MSRKGADFALLLLAVFRRLADAATAELARRGHPDFRPVHDFALRAIAGGAANATELGRRTGVSKQAAAKTIAALEQEGYVTRSSDTGDARRKLLSVTARGREVMTTGEAIFQDLHRQMEEAIGRDALADMERHLTRLVGKDVVPPWRDQDAGRD